MKTIIIIFLSLLTFNGYCQLKTFVVADTKNSSKLIISVDKLSKSTFFTLYSNGKTVCTDGNNIIYFEFREKLTDPKKVLNRFNREDFNCNGSYYAKLSTDTSDTNYYELFDALATQKLYAIVCDTKSTKTVRVNIDDKNANAIRQESLKQLKED